MEMAANVRSMRVICSPEQEEDAAAARELLHPPEGRSPCCPHRRGCRLLSQHVLVAFPSTPGPQPSPQRCGGLPH